MKLQDSFNRIIDYMRISITDRCNLRCTYCIPKGRVELLDHDELLRYEEIIEIIEAASELGVKKIRITGGEPLIKRNITTLIKGIKAVEGIEDLSLTTNGLFLEKQAASLAAAGLDRVNISIDSLKHDRFKDITGGGDLDVILKSIQAAVDNNLTPLKLNIVPIRGMNDDEIEDFAKITLSKNYQVRFIEFMPVGKNSLWDRSKYLPTEEIRERVSSIGRLIPVKERKHGPARYYRFENAIGVIGFISAVTHHFCEDCNRLRLTSEGKLRPCLFSDTEIDLKNSIRRGASREEIKRLLKLSIEIKPKGHNLREDGINRTLKDMVGIGG